MKWTPTPYMRRAVRWLLEHPEAALFLEPGLRKTSITLRAFKTLLHAQAAQRMLVVAPLSVAQLTWPAEIEKWDCFQDLTYALLHGKDKEQAARSKALIHIINYDGLAWLCRLKGYKWPDVLVMDELTKMKHTDTQRFRAFRPHLKNFNRRIGLTGTPAPNKELDLFGQLYALDLGERLGPYITRFKLKYYTQISDYEWIIKPDGKEQIIEQIRDICLYMSKKEHLSLPPCTETLVPIALPVKARRIYDDLEKTFYTELDKGVVTAANAGVKSGKLRQITGGAVYHSEGVTGGMDGEGHWSEFHTAKLDKLWDRIEEIGSPVIVVYEFSHEAERIEAMIEPEDCMRLTGGLNKRTKIIDQWNRGNLPVFLIQSSQVYGLNLQDGGNHIIRYSPTWNQEHHQQLIDRLHRSGQKHPVFVDTLVAQNTVDEVVNAARTSKARGQQELLNALRERRRKRKK